ncbi:sporulation protein YunB [Sporosarcina sp. P13]|uniref:sporulation protein YunB n=1 Tax=Sporosarcina sp. P13 TaxID=2048263 RepID=UPI000C16BF44|nr:sporulation protein YunB [Sporosarcina sp. P13]PIC62857.1 sporulation protein YunB [Sporosarcina sp. P13]
MRFYTNQQRPRRNRQAKNILRFIIPTIFVAVALFFYSVNKQLTPIYTQYAEVQTEKIAGHVISQAIKSRSSSIYDVNDIIENVPDDSTDIVTTKFNADIIGQVMAEVHQLVEDHLERAEGGELDMLPPLGDLEYNPDMTAKGQGIVFFVPLGQATNIPLIGNLGPKIPIRFHVIGDVHATVDTKITEFGINNAHVEVNVIVKVNVQIIVPLATSRSVVEQKIPVAIGLIRGKVPQIYSKGEQTPAQVEVPLLDPE